MERDGAGEQEKKQLNRKLRLANTTIISLVAFSAWVRSQVKWFKVAEGILSLSLLNRKIYHLQEPEA